MRLGKYTKKKPFDFKDIDFTIYGFRKVSEWSKGRKIKTDYLGEDGEKIVTKVFTDVIEDDVLIGIDIDFNYYEAEDNIVDTKTQRVYMDILEAGELVRKRRQRAIDKLVLSTRAFPQIAHVLDTIFAHYKVEIEKFIATGSDEFETAMNDETDTQIKGMLDAVANPQNWFTVKDSILHEITN